jgi:hypothetical protein
MPRLLPPEWIKLITRNYLLQLYEKEPRFVQEWNDVKCPFVSLIEQIARAGILNDAERLLARNPPMDLTAWVSDQQKLRKYLQRLQGISDLSQLQESYDSLFGQLAPYVLRLRTLADNWNLRAPWAGGELMWRHIHKIQQDILNVAGVASLFELSDQQIQRFVNTEKGLLPSDNLPINVLLLYLAGGRLGLTNKLNNRLKEFEQKLKAAGAKEPPSARRTHAEWWFDHYVYGKEFPEISNKLALNDDEGGPEPKNIEKAVFKFSEFLNIKPIERT